MTKRKDKYVTLSATELRALLFWSAIGMRYSQSGTYGDTIEWVIPKYADHLKFRFDKCNAPEWGANRRHAGQRRWSDMSFACEKCGDWLPSPEDYETFRGRMATEHTCLCGHTHTQDKKQNTETPAPVSAPASLDK